VAKSAFDDAHFNDEAAAFAYVESKLWPYGPVCPHCGNADSQRIRKMEGKTTRLGLYNCNECRKPFTVKIGTIFESSHLPLRLWLQVIHLMCSSKKGVSTNQVQRMLLRDNTESAAQHFVNGLLGARIRCSIIRTCGQSRARNAER
jgi:transposase-like protein